MSTSRRLIKIKKYPMFVYKFEEPGKRSPEYKVKDTAFTLYSVGTMLYIEYHGKSYKSVQYKIKINMKYEDIEDSHEFIYAYSLFSSSFGINLRKKKRLDSVSIVIKEHFQEQPFAGLENLGATCYINSLLQTLYGIGQFKEYIYRSNGYYSLMLRRLFYRMDLANSNGNIIKIGGEGFNEINEIFLEEAENTKTVDDAIQETVENTNVAKKTMSITKSLLDLVYNLPCVKSVHNHEDIHEFSKFIFDILENENPDIKALIEGEGVDILESKCGCKRTNTSVFQDLILSISLFGGKQLSSVKESLDQICSVEHLEDYRCSKHGKQQTKKRYMFKKLPPVLFILLKRFDVDWETGIISKNNKYYEFYEEIDFKSYIYGDEKDVIYRIHSVIVHSGISTEGHFYCFLHIGDEYYKFNDLEVYKSSVEEALDWNFGETPEHGEKPKKFSAYYLVYIRKDWSKDGDFEILRKILDLHEKQKFSYIHDEINREKNKKSMKKDMSVYIDWSSPISIKETIDMNRDIEYYCFEKDAVLQYKGIGAFNVTSNDYEKTNLCKQHIMLYGNSEVVFPNKTPYMVETKEENKDTLCYNISRLEKNRIVADKTYFICNNNKASSRYGNSLKKAGKLVFLKKFVNPRWCGMPNGFVYLGIENISDEKELLFYASIETNDIYREIHCRNDNNRLEIAVEKLDKYSLKNVIDGFRDGDVVIFSEMEEELRGFYRKYNEHQIIQVFYQGQEHQAFINRKYINPVELGMSIRRYFLNEDLEIMNMYGNLITEKNKITLENRTDTYSYRLLISSSAIDINIEDHIHIGFGKKRKLIKFLKDLEKSELECFRMFLKEVRQKEDLSGEKNKECHCFSDTDLRKIQVVVTNRNCLDARIVFEDGVIDGKYELVVIQPRMENPIRVCFADSQHNILGYPFYIESPGSVLELRKKFFVDNKIVCCVGEMEMTYEMVDSSLLNLDPRDTLLIEYIETPVRSA